MATIYEYIKESPQAYRHVLENRAAISESFVELYRSTMPDVVFLVGSGTSLNGCLAAAPFMEMVLGQEVRACAASDMPSVHGMKPLFIYVSQGGNSTNTSKAIEDYSMYPSLVITGSEKGYINAMGTKWQLLECGEELAGPKTKGYIVTIIQLYVAALETAKALERISEERYQEIVGVLEKAGENFDGNVEASDEWFKRNVNLLKGLHAVFMTGKKLDAVIAREDGLKIMETLLIPVLAYDFEEALHGPASCLDNRVAGFYFVPEESDPDAQRTRALAEFHRKRCGAVFTITSTETGDPRDCVVKTTGEWYTSPFERSIACQLVGALIPGLTAMDPQSGHQRFRELSDAVHTKHQEDH